MANWEKFTIVNKWTREDRIYVEVDKRKFGFDWGPVLFFANCHPFSTYQRWDQIEVNMSRFRGENCLKYWETICDASVIRIARSLNMGNIDSMTEVIDSLIENKMMVLHNSKELSRERDSLKSDLQRVMEEGVRELTVKNNQIKRKDEQIGQLGIQLTTSQNQVKEKETQITQKDSRINQLSSDLVVVRDQSGKKDTRIKQLETEGQTKDGQIVKVTNERNDYEKKWTLNKTEVKKITDSFNKLTLEKKQKENELRQKEREVIELKEQLGLSQEEILTNKIASRERELDNTIYSLKFNHEIVMNLCDAYERLDLARRDYNRDNITNAKNNIKVIKEELFTFATENKTGIDDLYKIYQSCEEIAKWRVELEQLKENQYQARQEVLINH